MKRIVLTALVALVSVPATAGAGKDIVATAASAGTFETLLRAAQEAGLAGALKGEGPLTVFAPTDKAFAKLPKGALEGLLKAENRDRLISILAYHVVPARVTAAEAIRLGRAETLSGAEIRISLREGRMHVNDSAVVGTDISASNGLIHVIETVLMPPTPEMSSRRSAASILTLAIERGVPLFNAGQEQACADVYEVAARALLGLEAGLSQEERGQLRKAVDGLDHERDASARAWRLRRAFDEILPNLERSERKERAMNAGFEPLIEAPLPKGFPGPGPLGEVVVKEYPRYRAARTEGGGAAFWTLFNHIKKNDIAMTAPVEMTMKDNGGGAMTMQAMAFLYESAGQGQAGTTGRVEVVDLEPRKVLSIGMRGLRNAESIAEARKAIEARLDKDGWKRAGDWRLLGYNSPMVPANDRFWELQLPVKR